jgi:hypothetical protein
MSDNGPSRRADWRLHRLTERIAFRDLLSQAPIGVASGFCAVFVMIQRITLKYGVYQIRIATSLVWRFLRMIRTFLCLSFGPVAVWLSAHDFLRSLADDRRKNAAERYQEYDDA